MRMWGINPKLMCRKHLLGEHVEMHMLVGAINKNKNLKGFYSGLIDLTKINERHNKLAQEIIRRGYNHKSPLPNFITPNKKSYINLDENQEELKRRCKDCRKLIENERI